MKNVIILIALYLAISSFYAEASTSRSRGFVESYLGMKAAEFIFGKEDGPGEITLPKIPEVKKQNTDQKVFEKKSALFKQGESYNSLSQDKKKYYQVAYIEELLQAVRQAEYSDEEVEKWYNSISQGASREGVYRALVLDQIYSRMESVSNPPDDKLLDFTIEFSQKYHNKNFKRESLSKANLYTIKRVLTENSLEVIDELIENPKDVYSWYAVFSSEMAQKFGHLWKGKLRSSTDKTKHYQWAQTVPFQHIKSELILKLHSALNSLDS